MINKLKKSFGLTLAAGGAKGYIHIGILKKLEEENIIPNYISGSSIGALIGGMYALGYTIKEIEDFAIKYNKKYLLEYTIPSKSLIKTDKIHTLLKEIFNNKTFDDCKIKLYIAKTNLTKEDVEYVDSGTLYDAILASISIPGIFPSIHENDNIYVDGGVLDPIPIKPLKNKADINLAVKFYYDYKSPINRTPEIINILFKTLSASQNYITKSIIEREKPDILIDCKESKKINVLDFKNQEQLIELGYLKMQTNIKKLTKLLKK